MFFKRGEIVNIDGKPRRWCIDQLRETSLKGEPVLLADLSDVGGEHTTVDTMRLTKVAG